MGKLSDADSFESGIQRRPANVPVKQPETWGEMFKAWPKTTLCIVSNEFCERFSYYGMRTVLTLYLLNVLKFSDSVSTIAFNGFTVLCYFTPLFGSIVADGYVGKFKTIFVVSIVYAIGQILLALASTQNSESSIHPWVDIVGLVTIGFGTGGIKPCVASFGGDQFEPGQERMLSLFFSVFYFSINAGSMISTFISPIFRSKSCLGQDSCYPMAFGIPAVLMIVATMLFMAGSFSYKKPPPKDNIYGEVWRLFKGALKNRGKGPKRDHWCEYYLVTHTCDNDEKCQELKREKNDQSVCQKVNFVDDVKSLLRVLIMFLPVPIFWALYDQQGSVWLIQAIQMDCRIWGNTLLLPDQTQTLNAVLILVFIPIFQVIIYPIIGKIITLTPLRKMVAGGVIAAGAFVVSGFVQIQVNKTLATLPPDSSAYISVMNTFGPEYNCTLNITLGDQHRSLLPGESINDNKHLQQKLTFESKEGSVSFAIKYVNCAKNPANPLLTYTDTVSGGDIFNLVIGPKGSYMFKVDPDKPTEGTGESSMSVTVQVDDRGNYTKNLCFCRITKDTDKDHPCNPQVPSDFYYYEQKYNDGKKEDFQSLLPVIDSKGISSFATISKFKPLKPGDWNLYFLNETAKSVGMKSLSKTQIHVEYTNVKFSNTKQGGVRSLIITGKNGTYEHYINVLVPDNTVSILWQVPQIFIITVAEILFSITGYEFAYSQSAPSMKAMVQGMWLLTTAVGDTIIVIIAAFNIFSNPAVAAFVYAGLMMVVILIFALMSIFYYEYKYYTGVDDDDNVLIEDDAISTALVKDAVDIGTAHHNNKAYEDEWDTRF
uniref:Oligopeptide transporter 1 n=1 Tax=Panagrellus redivivus TaxID=6233 RepID=A0A7E4ZUA9_PANRE